MWTSLALMTALSWTPAQANQLEIKNARFTYGILGQERKSATFLPGDMVVLAYDIDGLKTKPNGSVEYVRTMKLYFNKETKPVLEKTPQQMSVINSLGGQRQSSIALTQLYTDAKPGEYTMSLTVEDKLGNTKATLDRKFTVKPMEFGIVNCGFVYVQLNEEQAGVAPNLAPPLAVPGQNMMLHFTVVGYQKHREKETPDVEVKMVVQDEAGKAVLEQPISGRATGQDDESKKWEIIPFHIPIQINRPGKFKLVVTAEDKNANGKKTELTLDLRVIEVK